MRVLTVNAGSSSLKLSVLGDDDRPVLSETLVDDRDDGNRLGELLRRAGPVGAVGHRIVHGGAELTGPVRIDTAVMQQLEALTDLAPLHQPKSLDALRSVSELLPDVPAVACFDTAFHSTIPPAAATYAIPAEWRRRWPLRRFGFHGLSHAYATRRAAELLDRPVETLRMVTCHLGAGASLAAVQGGRSIDTTMGFTPLEGLVMATRSGSVDPGLLLWLVEHAGISVAELSSVLEHRSGLLGLAGTPDMGDIVEQSASGRDDARLGLDVYLHRLRSAIGAMAASLGGVDAVVFTGGVGENAALVRQRVADRLGFLGLAVDPVRNQAGAADREISPDGAGVACLVIRAREDLQIALETRTVLGVKP